MPSLRDQFAALLQRRPAPSLARAALEIARLGYPELDPGPSLHALDDLAAGLRERLAPTTPVDNALARLVEHLYETIGFHGNAQDYYDPRNSFLNDVLHRHTGIPITLAVVVVEVGARVGLPVSGVGVPGHFLVRVETPDAPLFLDPFSGELLGHRALAARIQRLIGSADAAPPDLLAPATRPAILSRMLHNLLRVYLDRDEPVQALATVDLLSVLTPDAPDTLRARGLLLTRLDCAAAAIADLTRYLALFPDAPDAEAIRTELVRLSRTASTIH